MSKRYIGSKLEGVVVLEAARTPTGKFGGSLATFHPRYLGGKALAKAIEKAGISPEELGEVIFGNVVGAGLGQNIARQVAYEAGVPLTTTAHTVNQVCASSSRAVISIAQNISLGIYVSPPKAQHQLNSIHSHS